MFTFTFRKLRLFKINLPTLYQRNCRKTQKYISMTAMHRLGFERCSPEEKSIPLILEPTRSAKLKGWFGCGIHSLLEDTAQKNATRAIGA
jgi:hypothetical protein